MAQHASPRPRGRALGNLAVFLLGIGLAVAFYAAVDRYMPPDSLLVRYCCAHPIEYVEVWMFFWGLSALAGKWLHLLWQRSAVRRQALPAWDGKPVAVSEASKLLEDFAALPRRFTRSLVGRRLLGGLEFVAGRSSTDGLDDYLRDQSDADADALDGGHALLRFITWAIPILGFLGTVLGITDAIANVTPEALAKSITGVTDGLAIAFDTTALALAFSMCLMFFDFVIDRGEQGLLNGVDQVVDRQLAHRFERLGSEKNEFVSALKQNTLVLLQSTEKLVERQAEVWSKSLAEMRSNLEKGQREQREHFTTALRGMLEQTLDTHQQRLKATEELAAEHTTRLLDHFEKRTGQVGEHFNRLSGSVQSITSAWQQQAVDQTTRLLEDFETRTGQVGEHFDRLGGSVQMLTSALAQQANRLVEQVAALKQVMEAEGRLADLQETLDRNLQSVAHANTLQQAVHSLTAAIHLLTANAGAAQATGPNTAGTLKFTPRQGNAA